jgi:hypothetical protein
VIRPTHNAIESLCLFYPRADEEAVLEEVAQGLPIDGEIAVRLVGRQRLVEGSRYVLHRERTGLFVLRDPDVVITFLRFYAHSQHVLACTLWPGGDAPTCKARWNSPDGVLPPPDRRRWTISAGALRKARRDKAAIRAHVALVIDEDDLQPAIDYYVPGVEVTGLAWLEGVPLGVLVGADEVRVTAAELRPEIALARRKQIKRLNRRKDAAQTAAAFLRSMGWTCTPPSGGQEGP